MIACTEIIFFTTIMIETSSKIEQLSKS